ncbi:hypothetical protein D9613_008972 [Agrocybe pediades]|uniref:Uncharacterized protein n=1 Tax=Agrocybe pediades TaxID=84607 RepID=A0A8H4VW48_9AGAR|nr:hypothetical protein D9613_008972 [Agrocybe pediades]
MSLSSPSHRLKQQRRPSGLRHSTTVTEAGEILQFYQDLQRWEPLELDLSLPIDNSTIHTIDRLLPASPRHDHSDVLVALTVRYTHADIRDDWDFVFSRIKLNANRIKSLCSGPTIIGMLMRHDPLGSSPPMLWNALESLEVKRMFLDTNSDEEDQLNHVLVNAPFLTRLSLRPLSVISDRVVIPYGQITHLAIVDENPSLHDCWRLIRQCTSSSLSGSSLMEIQISGRLISIPSIPSILRLVQSSLVSFTLHNDCAYNFVATQSSLSATDFGPIRLFKLKNFIITSTSQDFVVAACRSILMFTTKPVEVEGFQKGSDKGQLPLASYGCDGQSGHLLFNAPATYLESIRKVLFQNMPHLEHRS